MNFNYNVISNRTLEAESAWEDVNWWPSGGPVSMDAAEGIAAPLNLVSPLTFSIPSNTLAVQSVSTGAAVQTAAAPAALTAVAAQTSSDVLKLAYKGFNYPAFYNGAYAKASTLASLAATGANSVALVDRYSIDVNTSTVVADPNYTNNLTSLGDTIKQAVADGLQVMVRPLIDFLNSSIDDGMTGKYRSYYNPTNPAAFFASYQAMLVAEAKVAQANGAQVFCIGTELDQLTGPAYLSYWTSIISAVRAVFTGKLTYSAEWDDAISPWKYGNTGLPLGTGNIATQISFWNQLDYIGIDEYAVLSTAANPTEAQLVAGWEDVPTVAATEAVTGNQSLISYFEGISKAIGKPLFFTEIGYEDATDAASRPYGTSTHVLDEALQAELYQALGTAWSAENNGSLIGVNFWDWDPNQAETAPAHGPNFSPQSNPAALAVIDSMFSACYAEGTSILNADGRGVPVEELRVGDAVRTLAGAARIIWLGRRRMDLRRHNRPDAVQPILITAGALGGGLPYQDLVVSPDHGMYLGGHLIPAKALSNGFSIRQLNRRKITYYHIELAEHAVIFAEGAAAESYLETGNRGAFENGGAVTLHPDFAQNLREASGCAPFAEAGPAVEAVRQHLLDHANIQTTSEPGLRISYENGAACIESRTCIPGELTADPRDRRRLGVKIAALEIAGEAIPLTHPLLREGWYDPEPDGRWTNGRALIPPDLLRGAESLTLHLTSTLPYPLQLNSRMLSIGHPGVVSATSRKYVRYRAASLVNKPAATR